MSTDPSVFVVRTVNTFPAMAQESDDVSSKFSTLNINATEFVPSFCVDDPEDESPVTAALEEPTSESVATINSVPASSTTNISSSNNNGTCTVAISRFDDDVAPVLSSM